MKRTILLSFLVAIFSFGALAQTEYDTIKVSYTLGNIGTSHLFRYDGDTSPCPGYLNVPVPNNAIVTTVDVEYAMTASAPQRMYDQRSQLWCTSPGGEREPEVYKGTGYGYGTVNYARTGLDIAFGIKPIFDLGVDFQLHAGTNNYSAADTCTDEFNRVDSATWSLTVYYLPPGSPDFPSNPTPSDEAQLVSLTPELTWDFSANTSTYDLYFGTDNPPTTKVVDNESVTRASGSYTPADTLQEATVYYWKVVPKNSTNENPGIVWSFKTKCATPDYPYFENFDAVTVPNLPDCWIAATNGGYNTIQTAYSSSYSHSYPNYVKFSAQDVTAPELVLVLPKVDNIKDMVLSIWGKNPTNWTSGTPYSFPFEIGTITDPFDYSTFTSIESFIPGGDYTYHETYFNDYSGTDEYIAIRANVPPLGGSLFLDDVTLDFIPDCVKPLDLVLDSISATSATISWTDLISSPGKWEIEYDTIGSDIGTGTRVEVTTNPATITGLQDGAYYDVYARSICGEGDTSEWSLPLTILTECLPKDLPIFEDFGIRPPYPQKPELNVCWNIIQQTASYNGGVFLSDYYSHTGVGITFTADGDTSAKLLLVTPQLVPDMNGVQTSFWAKRGPYGGEKALIVGTMSDPTDASTFHPYDTLTLEDEFNYYTVYFLNYSGDDHYIAWMHNSHDFPVDKAYLDDIEIEEIASCIVPVNINITGIKQTSVTLSWEDLNSAKTWEILVGDQGFVPGTDPATSYYYNDEAANGSESTEVKGLETGKLYDIYMRTICSETDQSEWEGPLTFRTSLAMNDLPGVEDFENGNDHWANSYGNGKDWELDTNLYVSANHSIHNAYGANQQNSLTVGSFDLSGKTSPVLSFYQICKTDGNYDHSYVEISTDGGYTYSILPMSTYYGNGRYRVDGVYNFPEGPVFDEDSYPEWGTGYQTPTNDWWKKEYFDLTDYAGYSNVVIRFRITTNGYTNKAGWYIDDVTVYDINGSDVTVDPTSITETVVEDSPENITMTMSNGGDFPAKYKVKVVYDEQALLTENFDNGIPDTWTTEANGTNDSTWRSATAYQTYYSFNGTKFAMCSGSKDYAEIDKVTDGVLLTPVVDASEYLNKGLRLEFDQAFADYYTPGDTAQVYVYDGTQWVMIYNHYQGADGRLSYNSNGVHKAYDVSQYANANFQVKFRYIVGSGKRGYYFAIENFRLRASEFPLGWLTIDGTECVPGFNFPDPDSVSTSFDVKLDPTGLPYDTYSANIVVESSDPAKDDITVPVTMTVQGIPYNVNLVFVDEEGNPLEGVTAAFSTDTVQTGADGVASFAGYVSGEYNYCAKKSGYGKVTGSITVDHADYNDTIVMLDAYKLAFWFTHEGVALEGVEVTVEGQTLTADMDGFAMFEDLIPGSYDYTASLEGYMTVSGTVPIDNGDVNVIVEMPSEPHNVTFVCMENGAVLSGVDVTMDGVTVTTDENGVALFADKFPGVYSYTATKDSYIPVYGTVEVTDSDVTVNVDMEPVTYSVSFYCYEDDGALEGVVVTMDNTIGVSDTNGLVLFTGMLPGTYVFTIYKDGYFINIGQVNIVDSDVDVNVLMTPITYKFTFNVNNGANPVEGAVVEFNGSTRISDANGNVVFDGVTPGTHTYTVSLDGNVVYENSVEAPDQVSELGFDGNVNVNVTMSITGINNTLGENVAIYPVPAKDVVNIDNAQNATMKLVDLSGRTVMTKDIETNHSKINVSSLHAGVYFIYLRNSDQLSTYKIIVTK